MDWNVPRGSGSGLPSRRLRVSAKAGSALLARGAYGFRGMLDFRLYCGGRRDPTGYRVLFPGDAAADFQPGGIDVQVSARASGEGARQ